MFKEFLTVTCLLTICYSAAVKDLQPEIKSAVPENGIEEPNDSESLDLDAAEGKHFGSKVLVVKGFGGGYGGYGGGYGRGGYGGYGGGGYGGYGGGGYGGYGGGGGCGCGGGGYGHHHHHHKFYGK